MLKHQCRACACSIRQPMIILESYRYLFTSQVAHPAALFVACAGLQSQRSMPVCKSAWFLQCGWYVPEVHVYAMDQAAMEQATL